MNALPKELTAGLVLNLMSILLSLACSYSPKLRDWWAAKENNKAIMQLIVITLICTISGVLNWTGIWPFLTSGSDGVITLIIIWFSALVTNQTTYTYTKDKLPSSVVAAKAARSKR